jgi:hypothetical protein
MISATDSFLQYLSTQLAGSPPVHWLRRDASDPTAHLLQHGYLNVSALSYHEDGTPEEILVSLDIIASSERQAWQWAKIVRDKLIEKQYTPELDYEADPESPVPLGRNVSWNGREVDFDLIRSDMHNVHLNATFNICHVRH